MILIKSETEELVIEKAAVRVERRNVISKTLS